MNVKTETNKKRSAILIFFLNALVMLIMGIVTFNKDLVIWVRLIDISRVIFWYINVPIMSFFGLIITYFVVKLLVIMSVKLFCLIPAVDKIVDKQNLTVFKNKKNPNQ